MSGAGTTAEPLNSCPCHRRAILAIALFAYYGQHLAGAWRWIYVVTAIASLYLNVFVLVVQSFVKVAALDCFGPAGLAMTC